MTPFMPQPGQGLMRVSLLGPMGIGKTTALRSLCGELMAGSDVRNLDKGAHAKEFTTVGAEFGEIDLGDGERVQLCGCPGQDRFDFMRQWVISVSVGIFVMADLHAPDALELTSALLHETAAVPLPPVTLVLSAREASQAQIEAFAAGLMAAGHGVVPVLPVDVRDRNQMLQALGVLVTMLSLRNESL